MSLKYLIALIYLNLTAINGLPDKKPKPNIIILVADDLGWDDVGFHGSRDILTPNIDLLAKSGIILNQHYVSSLCTPSRGALLSGLYPIRTGTQNSVIKNYEPRGFPLDKKLMPQYFKNSGYKTHAVGKWHLGFFKKEYTPDQRGFDSFYGFWTYGGDYFDHIKGKPGQWGYDFRFDQDTIRNASGRYSTELFTERAVKIIADHDQDQSPLFMYMAYQSVHCANSFAPYQAPLDLIKKFDYIKDYERKIFAAMAYAMDDSIGKITNALSSKGILANTIIYFTSDNGAGPVGIEPNPGSNAPLRGMKATLWEGGVRVPAFIWSPILKNSGRLYNGLVHVTDILPTLLEAIGHPLDEHDLDGISMWDSLSNLSSSKRTTILHNIDPITNSSAIRVGDYKLIQGIVVSEGSAWFPTPLSKNCFISSYLISDQTTEIKLKETIQKLKLNFNLENVIVNCGEKPDNLVKCDLATELCLFNIAKDPCEYNNVAYTHPDIVETLWNSIIEYNKTAIKPGNLADDPSADPGLHSNIWSSWM